MARARRAAARPPPASRPPERVPAPPPAARAGGSPSACRVPPLRDLELRELAQLGVATPACGGRTSASRCCSCWRSSFSTPGDRPVTITAGATTTRCNDPLLLAFAGGSVRVSVSRVDDERFATKRSGVATGSRSGVRRGRRLLEPNERRLLPSYRLAPRTWACLRGQPFGRCAAPASVGHHAESRTADRTEDQGPLPRSSVASPGAVVGGEDRSALVREPTRSHRDHDDRRPQATAGRSTREQAGDRWCEGRDATPTRRTSGDSEGRPQNSRLIRPVDDRGRKITMASVGTSGTAGAVVKSPPSAIARLTEGGWRSGHGSTRG